MQQCQPVTWSVGPQQVLRVKYTHFRLASCWGRPHFRFRNTWAEVPSFLFPVVWRQNGLSRRLHMAAGLGLLAQGGYMCRLRSVAGTGYIHVRSFQLQNPLSTILWMEFTAEPFDGLWSRCLQSIIWRAMQLKRKEVTGG